MDHVQVFSCMTQVAHAFEATIDPHSSLTAEALGQLQRMFETT